MLSATAKVSDLLTHLTCLLVSRTGPSPLLLCFLQRAVADSRFNMAGRAVCSEELGNSYQISGSQPYSLTLVCLCLRPKLVDMADCPEGCDLAGEQLVLAACSTQGDGVAPAEAREFCDWLQSVAAPKLQGTAFAVCALGDRWACRHESRPACDVSLDLVSPTCVGFG